jgi:crossover junction endodeoxyribonuclease RuvC
VNYIGIDPGKSGALAVIHEDGLICRYIFDEETYVNCLSWFKSETCNAVCCLEHVGAMPGQGVTSMFSFGQNFGFIQGVLKANGIPFELVRPQKWKKEFSITADKNTSIEVCKRLFPNVSLRRTDKCTTDHDGMAEALLLAEYARRKLRATEVSNGS